MRHPWLRPAVGWRVLRAALILFFIWLVARHWDPYYGFTRFLQCDPHAASLSVPALRGTPLFVHPDPGSYDGFYYAEIATDPTLRNPALAPAVDDLGYRARRILLSAVAWVIGFGDPTAATHAYAWLNVIAWAVLAGLLWRLFPDDARGTIAWTGLVFATGTLLSVRLALADLTALLLTAAALMQIERNRNATGSGLLALAGLARETALLGLVSLLPRGADPRRRQRAALAWAALAIVPLAAWLVYLWVTVGSSDAGLRNFAWPFTGWFRKTSEVLAAFGTESNRSLVVGSALCLLALTVQWIHLVTHPAPQNPWWRTGAAYALLMTVLGPAVWGDDLPGASVRVLLPLALAFNVIAVRARAPLAWLALGNVWIVGGVLSLWTVQRDPHEFATGRMPGGSYVVHTDPGWHGVESRRTKRWAWCAQQGTLTLDTWPREARTLRIAVALQAFTPRDLEIRSRTGVLWQGHVDGAPQWVELEVALNDSGRTEFEVRSPTAPVLENQQPHARLIGFAVCGFRVD